jgi:hypothetical protein
MIKFYNNNAALLEIPPHTRTFPWLEKTNQGPITHYSTFNLPWTYPLITFFQLNEHTQLYIDPNPDDYLTTDYRQTIQKCRNNTNEYFFTGFYYLFGQESLQPPIIKSYTIAKFPNTTYGRKICLGQRTIIANTIPELTNKCLNAFYSNAFTLKPRDPFNNPPKIDLQYYVEPLFPYPLNNNPTC